MDSILPEDNSLREDNILRQDNSLLEDNILRESILQHGEDILSNLGLTLLTKVIRHKVILRHSDIRQQVTLVKLLHTMQRMNGRSCNCRSGRLWCSSHGTRWRSLPCIE